MSATTTMIDGQHWYSSHRADPRARALYLRHYSSWKRRTTTSRHFVAPGSCLVLLTSTADALFVWHYAKSGMRSDGLDGISCSVFRNESRIRASTLILEAETLARTKWPHVPLLLTYVDPARINSTIPGYCFRRAGWKHTGTSKRGLLLFTKRIKPTTLSPTTLSPLTTGRQSTIRIIT